MDELPPNALIVTPTKEFFMAGEVMVRAWTGHTRDGIECIALIASVALKEDKPLPGMVPIPPPEPYWDPDVRQAMGRIWKIAGTLLPEEAAGLALIAEKLISIPSPEIRRFCARQFLSDAGGDGE